MKKFLILIFTLAGQVALTAQDYTMSILQHRADYKAEFLAEDRSPLGEADLDHLRFFDPDERYRVTFSFERTPDAKSFDMATYSGITKPYVQYGWLTGQVNGREIRLAVYQNLRLRLMPKYRDLLFLPFKDASNGSTTYGGGRYIDLSTSAIKGDKVVVDFNKAYNPWCAYSDGFNCPIPPPANHLEISILAGEKAFAGKKK